MLKKYPYPVQMASIKKEDWRLKRFLDEGASTVRLFIEEYRLWKRIKRIADSFESSPTKLSTFKNSKLLGRGWEWAVYSVSDKKVVKVPAGVFAEVNEGKYLENTKLAYKLCKKYLGRFVIETTFERKRLNGVETNIIKQRKIVGSEIDFIRPGDLSTRERRNFIELSRKISTMLEREDWVPDLHLWRRFKDWRWGWNIWNIIIENETPYIFDFTAYYDNLRLYPQRMKLMRNINRRRWRRFLKEMSRQTRDKSS